MTGPAVVTATTRGVIRVVHVSGEVDMANAVDVLGALVACSGEADDVVVDLAHVTYLDSAGVRMVSDLLRRFEGEGRRLVFSIPQRSTCRRVIEMTLPGLPVVDADEDA